MLLIEKHIIKKTHKYYDEIDKISFLSKNIYNSCLYNVRQEFILNKKFLSLKDNYDIVKNKIKTDYYALPAKVSNQVIKQVDTDFRNFFKAIKQFKKTPDKFLGRPKLPNYKHKTNGRNIITYEKGAISKIHLKNGFLNLSKTNIFIKTKLNYNDIKEVKISKNINDYSINICYYREDVPLKEDNGRYAGVDLGVGNLMAVAFNTKDKEILINGNPLKSINQYSNKILAKVKSELKKSNGKNKSNRTDKIISKRNNKINDYMHKTSRLLVNHLVSNNITKVVIGKNVNWKQDTNMSKKSNQNFVQIPHDKLIHMITYKCKLEGIEVILVNESYTSKCSFLDLEDICKHETYKGCRVKRGMFKASNGRIINADINAAYNILRKAISNAFANGIEGFAVAHPIKFNVV